MGNGTVGIGVDWKGISKILSGMNGDTRTQVMGTVPPVDQFLRECGIDPDFDYSSLKDTLQWGTYGKEGNDFHIVKLIDCETEHLENILITQKQISSEYTKVILLILKDRYREGK